MAAATIDVRVLGAGFAAQVMRRGMMTALDEVERRIARDRDKMNADYGTDYDAAVEDCLGVVAAVRADAESAPLPEDEAPAPPQWLDAPTGDGLWWRMDALGEAEVVRVNGAEDGPATVSTMGHDDDGAPGPEPHQWLRVDVPEAPR